MIPFLRYAVFATMLALAGCQTSKLDAPPPEASVVVEEDPEWVRLAAPGDVERIKGVGAAWAEALAEARRGFASQVEEEGPLLDPATALPRPAPTPGSYKCRLIKLGSTDGKARAFTAYKPFFCYIGVEGESLSLTKQTGSQRPGGYLYEDRLPHRMIFLGTVALGQEDIPLAYGETDSRDVAGVFERVASFRFRLVIPRPRGTSKLDVFEFIPSPVQPDE